MKLVSKIHHPTGKWRSFHQPYADLTISRALVGSAFFDNATNLFRISVRIKHGAHPGWRNALLKYPGAPTIQEAIKWAKDNWQTIQEKLDISPQRD